MQQGVSPIDQNSDQVQHTDRSQALDTTPEIVQFTDSFADIKLSNQQQTPISDNKTDSIDMKALENELIAKITAYQNEILRLEIKNAPLNPTAVDDRANQTSQAILNKVSPNKPTNETSQDVLNKVSPLRLENVKLKAITENRRSFMANKITPNFKSKEKIDVKFHQVMTDGNDRKEANKVVGPSNVI